MTNEDGVKFVETVLQVGWPKWQFTEREIGEWAKRLWPFDFDRAKKAILDFSFEYKKLGRPPTGQIFAILHKNAKPPKDRLTSGAVPLYNIIRPDGSPAGYPVSSARGVPANAEAVRAEAEELCARIARGRDGYFIQWLCEAVAPSTPL